MAFREAMKPSNISDGRLALKTTRDAAVKAAVSAFQATSQDAIAKLKAAFGR